MAIASQDAVKQNKSPLIANMYERWTLDCIIEHVQLIVMDFVYRPRQYLEVPPNISEILQNFRFLTGTDPKFPNRMQRSMAFEAILSSSDGGGMGIRYPELFPSSVNPYSFSVGGWLATRGETTEPF